MDTGTTFSNYRRTGIRYSCRDDPDIIYQRQICFPERDYFCIKESITVCCHPSWIRAEPDCYSGNREAITSDHCNHNRNFSDSCLCIA